MKRNPRDTWFFTGAKATYGTFNDADAVIGDSVIKPNTTTLPDTGHGLLAPSLLYIQNTTNYNGLRKIKSLANANSMLIYAKFVAETLSSATWKTMFTYDETIQGNLRPGCPFELLGFELTLNAAAATASEYFTIIIDAAKGDAWDNKIYSKDMNGIQYINNMFDAPRYCAPGDKIDVAWANANTNTWGIKLFTRRLI